MAFYASCFLLLLTAISAVPTNLNCNSPTISSLKNVPCCAASFPARSAGLEYATCPRPTSMTPIKSAPPARVHRKRQSPNRQAVRFKETERTFRPTKPSTPKGTTGQKVASYPSHTTQTCVFTPSAEKTDIAAKQTAVRKGTSRSGGYIERMLRPTSGRRRQSILLGAEAVVDVINISISAK